MKLYDYEQEDLFPEVEEKVRHSRLREEESRTASEGDAEAEVNEPWFPDVEDACAANQQTLADHGQTNHALLRPEVLEGALGRAQNYWAYEGDLAKAAAALAHGVGQAQAFEDGNKRTGFHLAHAFLTANGQGHAIPEDDEELADHLIGYANGTHAMDDTAAMFAQRMGQHRSSPVQFGYGYDDNGNHLKDYYRPGNYQRFLDDFRKWDPVKLQEEYASLPEAGRGWATANYRRALEQAMREQTKQANILDPIHEVLDPTVWQNGDRPDPKLLPQHSDWLHKKVFDALDRHGYTHIDTWLDLVLTGSLTTYQYSADSDCDISLFVNAEIFPDWSRAEMIGVMISECDGTTLPGTSHVIQCYVVSSKLHKEDLYKPGLRSGYDMRTNTWIVPPDRSHVHDVEHEMNEAYTIALENADKMEKLLRYEPDKAIMFWHQIHKRRMRDHQMGKGDYSPSNITYKMLNNRGLFPQIAEVSGEYIAATNPQRYYHSTQAELNPGDIVHPASQGYGDGSNNAMPGYDPGKVYLFDERHLNDPDNDPVYPNSLQHTYEVEPLGPLEQDAEGEELRRLYETRHGHPYTTLYHPEDATLPVVPGCPECERDTQDIAEGPEWYHPYNWATTHARVIRKV